MLPGLSHQSRMLMLDYVLNAVATGELKYHPIQNESTDVATSHLNKAIIAGAPTPPFVIFNDTLIHSHFGHPGWLYSMQENGPGQPKEGITFDLSSEQFCFGLDTEQALPVPDFYDFAFDIEALLDGVVHDDQAVNRVSQTKDALISAQIPVIEISSDVHLTPSVSQRLTSDLPWLFN